MADGAGDFDFELGSWTVRHRRLKDRLTGCTDWQAFSGTSQTRAILGGLGNVEDNRLHFPEGPYRAVAIRSYDPASQSWAIWWLSAHAPHTLDTPVKGAFTNGTGAFYADDHFRGQPVKVRFMWLHTTGDSPRWEQAFSPDGGQTWETNWTMDFTRA